uniref:NADH dehydrogenase subunit 4 n=1 Tax=Parachordodes pustulosus TaxID=3049253 RepID=UPI002E767962|nr:NADH dehydrogenase subunit 4 [Parachordodes pustulosus]WQH58895.1 NADH dehydrogenase subunit 4 [Parachordodes pustulosus]
MMFNLDFFSRFIILTMIFVFFCIMTMMFSKNICPNKLKFLSILSLLTSTMIYAVLVNKLILFYFLFELSLVPMILMIWGWGGGKKKVLSGNMILLYTSISSVPFLLLVLSYFFETKCSFWTQMPLMNMYLSLHGLLVATCVFFIKLPVYTMHMWLPKAHVEASTMGSMVLAGSLLKLGSYGLGRMTLALEGTRLVLLILSSMLLHGLLVATCVSCMQEDGKMMIAFSSVSHMTVLAGSLLTFSNYSMKANMMTSFIHGVLSPTLFFLYFKFYTNFKSRSLLIVKFSMMSVTWIMMITFSLILFFNSSCPPSLSILSEIFLMKSILNFNFNLFAWILGGFSVLMILFLTIMLSRIYLNKIFKKMGNYLFSILDFNFLVMVLMMNLISWGLVK